MVERVSLDNKEGKVLRCGNLLRAGGWVVEVTGTAPAASELCLRLDACAPHSALDSVSLTKK